MGQSSITVIDPNQNYNYSRQNTTQEVEEQIKRAFKQASPQGRLTRDKFNEALGIFESIQLKRLRDTPLADRLFQLLDRVRCKYRLQGEEGYITEREYLEGITTLINNKDKRITYSFQMIDKNKDNKIDFQEFYDFVKDSWLSAFRLLGEKVCSGQNQYQLTQSKINAWAQGQLNKLYTQVQEIFMKFAQQSNSMDPLVFKQWVLSNEFGFIKAELGNESVQIPLHLYRLEEK
ncbi:unnamed protein product (macronuclear) [Paramecium tetraurelia]|uniref:EF-hand domain-containing protein n=1 Tax=Paramecium tetraurelia TaxID=5888 RepID=A0DGG8_PARTE|nr:uncharacterized protein GSPATT00002264001 [Paramecium tetraurelia]CAK82135.1 unnamed protein product [Paramecium tetraurelia]|eukprot:XP_001449532.1 hypothetical protein (macronuclear) [Paramecium tetraurelia strain d4-2]